MKEYFALQFKMTNRLFKDVGFIPIFAYPILIIGFFLLSTYLFKTTEFAVYIYSFLYINLVGRLSETRRCEFLTICFGDHRFKKIRITENLICTVPFISFLLYKQLILPIVFLLLISIILAVLHFRAPFNYTIYTPFSKRPFEFTIGFRKTFPLLIIAYALVIIAANVNNFNLGIFSLMIVFGLSMSFYLSTENEYFVWNYSLNPKNFLINKIKTAYLYSSVIAIPIVVLLSFHFQQSIGLLFIFLLIGWGWIICAIVTKYSYFPNEINIPNGILLGLCLTLPPILIILTPILFYKAEKRLKNILK
ncbi:MAG: hypothetical protein RIR51_2014 [Bacteroidota bacterium]